MGLYGDVPSGIRLGVFDDRPDDPVVTAPFGLQVQSAPGGYPGGVGLGPSEVFLAFDDHFQFVGSRINTVYGGLLSFGGEADPVETACQFVRTRGFEEYFETPFRQPLRQIVQRIERGLPSRNDDGLRRIAAGPLDDRIDFDRRVEPGIPL